MSQQVSLDGDPVEVGDRVYHLLYGYGNVREVRPYTPKTFVATFGRLQRSVTEQGVDASFRQRTVYWERPMMVIPPKNAARWANLVAAMQALYSVLRGVI